MLSVALTSPLFVAAVMMEDLQIQSVVEAPVMIQSPKVLEDQKAIPMTWKFVKFELAPPTTGRFPIAESMAMTLSIILLGTFNPRFLGR